MTEPTNGNSAMPADMWEDLEDEASECSVLCESDLRKGVAKFLQLIRDAAGQEHESAVVYFVRAHVAESFLSALRGRFVTASEVDDAYVALAEIVGEPFADNLVEAAARRIAAPDDGVPALERPGGRRSEAELEAVTHLAHDALGFDDIGDEIRVLLSTVTREKRQMAGADDNSHRLTVAEGEAAALADLIGVIRKAYPRRRVGTQFASAADLGKDRAWREMDFVTLGDSNSNDAVAELMRLNKRDWPGRPDIWVHQPPHGKHYVGSVRATGTDRWVYKELDDDMCEDAGAILLRASQPFADGRMIAMLAGIETQGTAGAMLSLVESDQVRVLAERAAVNSAADNVRVRVVAGKTILWPMEIELDVE